MKDYRPTAGPAKIMTLDAGEFIRRFLIHVLPSGFHRIRHYGLFAGAVGQENIARTRQLLAAAANAHQPLPPRPTVRPLTFASEPCPCCGGRMIIVETFEGARPPQQRPPSRIRIDTS